MLVNLVMGCRFVFRLGFIDSHSQELHILSLDVVCCAASLLSSCNVQASVETILYFSWSILQLLSFLLTHAMLVLALIHNFYPVSQQLSISLELWLDLFGTPVNGAF